MNFSLPQLPYAHNALEPVISEETSSNLREQPQRTHSRH